MKANKQDLRYLGFECNNDGGREFDFSITTLGHVTKVVSVEVPALFFVGADRISFQEGPGICYEKLKQLLTDKQTGENRDRVRMSLDDVTRHRCLPKSHIKVRHWKSRAGEPRGPIKS